MISYKDDTHANHFSALHAWLKMIEILKKYVKVLENM